MTLLFESDLDSVKKNQHAGYVGQGYLVQKVIVQTQLHTHTEPTALRGPLKWSATSLRENTTVRLLPLSRIDERFWACRSRETGLELLDLPQFDCGVLGRSVAHLDDSVTIAASHAILHGPTDGASSMATVAMVIALYDAIWPLMALAMTFCTKCRMFSISFFFCANYTSNKSDY